MFPRPSPVSPLILCLGTAMSLVLAHAAAAEPAAPQPPAGDEAPLTTVTVTDSAVAIGQQPDAEGISDYRVTRGTTGAKGEVANADIPQSVTVIPQRVLEEQNIRTLNDAFRNVAGMQASQSAVQGAQYPNMRGFDSRNFYKDGMRDDTFDRSYWLGNVERIEVLKGPASVLYGDGNLGGVINVVSKKPLQDTRIGGALWGGNYGTGGAQADASVKLAGDGSALMRVVAEVDHKDTFVDNFDSDGRHFSALLQTRLGERTALSIGTEYRRRDIGNDSGLPAYAMDRLGRSANFNAEWSERADTGQNISARLTHDLNAAWKVNTGLLLNNYEFRQHLTSTSWTAANGAANTVTRAVNDTDSVTQEVISDTNLEGDVSLAGIGNKVVVGTELSYGHVRRSVYNGGTSVTGIYAPVTSFTLNPTTYSSDLRLNTYREALYAQDLIELTPQLRLMVGLRYDDVRREQDDPKLNPSIRRNLSSHDNALSERTGATYDVVPGVTVFAGYTHSFVPAGTSVSLGENTANGALFEPETGTQYEGGVKLDLGQSVTATAAVYQLTRQNVKITDPVTGVISAVGEQQSNGVELDATWKIAPGWNLLAAYAYTDARITKDKTYAEGNALVNVAPHTGRLWSVYEMQDGPAAGLGFGGGVTYVGDRPANLLNTYSMPGYTTVDLTAYYPLTEAVRFVVNADNIFDKRYYVSSNAADRPMVNVGEPFTIVGRLQASF